MDVALDFLEESGTHSIFIFLPPYRVYLFYVQPVPIFFFFFKYLFNNVSYVACNLFICWAPMSPCRMRSLRRSQATSLWKRWEKLPCCVQAQEDVHLLMFIDFLVAAVFLSSSLSLGSTSSSCGTPSSFVAFPLCKSRRRCCGFQTSAWRRSTSYCLYLRGWKLN